MQIIPVIWKAFIYSLNMILSAMAMNNGLTLQIVVIKPTFILAKAEKYMVKKAMFYTKK